MGQTENEREEYATIPYRDAKHFYALMLSQPPSVDPIPRVGR